MIVGLHGVHSFTKFISPTNHRQSPCLMVKYLPYQFLIFYVSKFDDHPGPVPHVETNPCGANQLRVDGEFPISDG